MVTLHTEHTKPTLNKVVKKRSKKPKLERCNNLPLYAYTI